MKISWFAVENGNGGKKDGHRFQYRFYFSSRQHVTTSPCIANSCA